MRDIHHNYCVYLENDKSDKKIHSESHTFTIYSELYFLISGGVISVHCETSAFQGEVVTSSEDIKEIETKISELLNNTSGLSRKQRQSVARRLKELNEFLIHLMAAYPTGSIVVYFLCQTFRSIVVLKGMIDSGQMKNILEDIFNGILKNDSIRLKLNVSVDLEEYQKRIQEARTTSMNI